VANSPKYDFGQLHPEYQAVLKNWKTGDEFTSHHFIDALKRAFRSEYEGVLDAYGRDEPTAHAQIAKSLRRVREVKLLRDRTSSRNLQGEKGKAALWKKC